MNNNTFHLFSTCIPIKGYRRSIIYDLNRSLFYYVPNDLFNVLKSLEKNSLTNLMETVYSNNRKVVKEYLDFLYSNELGFYLNLKEVKNFPKIKLDWDYPEIITNTILDLPIFNKRYLKDILGKLELLGCSSIEIRIVGKFKLSEIIEIFNLFENTIIQTIDLFVQDNSFSKTDFINLIKNNRIRQIVVYNSNETSNYENLFFTKTDPFQNIEINKYDFFTINIPFFTEAQSFNTYFNRKLYVDRNGNLRNSPETSKIYGNISNDDIIKIISLQDFKEIWYTPKSKIKPCNICEYRLMCFDNRIPFQKSNSKNKVQYYYDKECEYNPYKMKWRNGYGKITN